MDASAKISALDSRRYPRRTRQQNKQPPAEKNADSNSQHNSDQAVAKKQIGDNHAVTIDEIELIVGRLNELIEHTHIRFKAESQTADKHINIALYALDTDELILKITAEELIRLAGSGVTHDELFDLIDGNLLSITI